MNKYIKKINELIEQENLLSKELKSTEKLNNSKLSKKPKLIGSFTYTDYSKYIADSMGLSLDKYKELEKEIITTDNKKYIKSIDYSKYIAENLDKSIDYSNYIAESLINGPIGTKGTIGTKGPIGTSGTTMGENWQNGTWSTSGDTYELRDYADNKIKKKFTIPVNNLITRQQADQQIKQLMSEYQEDIQWDEQLGTVSINGSRVIPQDYWFSSPYTNSPQEFQWLNWYDFNQSVIDYQKLNGIRKNITISKKKSILDKIKQYWNDL